ncbi:type II secretion system protein [Clostridium lacusfryxellense]|uniref:type II secretion system protein n=1 Tax=Clostridium lacusfryxellense TaxID=205328 RepID=UPI001C0DACA1|nr:type II secretion system protein [Clostridium lacusfryxellense]MBU3110251.1 type II secretion system GspH family protein [Clostridium lacusfryxellense]
MKKGFTLVELIASLAIFAMAMVAISMAFFASTTTRQMNDVKQSTAGYAQAIIETFRGSTETVYKTVDSTESPTFIFVYFNNMVDFNDWYKAYIVIGAKITTKEGNPTTYPLPIGNQLFGALIKINKKSAYGVNTYNISVRVWRIDKGARGESVRDIYESR